MIYAITNKGVFEGWINTPEELSIEDGYLPQEVITQPEYDSDTEYLVENPPVIEEDVAIQSWRVEPLPVSIVEDQQKEIEVVAAIEELKDPEPVIETLEERIERLEKILAFKFA